MEEKGNKRRGSAVVVVLALLVAGGGWFWLQRRHSRPTGPEQAASGLTSYCPMHPHVHSDKPGNCPICGMKLVPHVKGATPSGSPFGGQAGAPPTSPSAAAPTPVAPAVRIVPERQQRIGVTYAEAAVRPARVEVRAVGRVAYDETRIAHIHTKVTGWIEDVFVDFVGAPVRVGQPLFTVYSPDLVVGQEQYLLALKANLRGSAIAHVSQGADELLAASRRRLELWDFTPEQVRSLEEAGTVSRTVTLHSPVAGVVTERQAYHHGRTITPEMDLYTIVDLSRVWVQASLYESEAPSVKVGQAAEVTLPYGSRQKALSGRVTFISPLVDPMTRTIQVRTEFPNTELLLRPEAFVNVSLKRDLGPRLVVPKDAVMDTGETQYVFVDKGDGYLEPREIKAGLEVDTGRLVEDGLVAGERVATGANFILDSESRLKGAFDDMGKPLPAAAVTSTSPSRVSAEVTTDPAPAKIGKNHVRAVVKDASGQPIADAEVEVRLFMPQMAGMAQVDVRAPLRPEGGGAYSGDVDIPIAWSFEVTLTVHRGGQVLGTAETTITSR
jgi:Cu(I)/Ag(I) efflux system membrane fusion protein